MTAWVLGTLSADIWSYSGTDPQELLEKMDIALVKIIKAARALSDEAIIPLCRAVNAPIDSLDIARAVDQLLSLAQKLSKMQSLSNLKDPYGTYYDKWGRQPQPLSRLALELRPQTKVEASSELSAEEREEMKKKEEKKKEKAKRLAEKRAANVESKSGKALPAAPHRGPLPVVPDAKNLQLQLRIIYHGGTAANTEREAIKVESKVWREVIVSGNSTLHDLMKTVVMALGLGEYGPGGINGYPAFDHTPGTGKSPKVNIFDRDLSDPSKPEQTRVDGLEYATGWLGMFHSNKALKAVQVAQIFDTSWTSAENRGVNRDSLGVSMWTEKRIAFMNGGGGVVELDPEGIHNITIVCMHIDKKQIHPGETHLRSNWESWAKSLPRCTGGLGQVPNGNVINWKPGTVGFHAHQGLGCVDIDNLNEAFWGKRKVRGVIFGDGTFNSIRGTMRSHVAIIAEPDFNDAISLD